MIAGEVAGRYAPGIVAAPLVPLISGQPFDMWWAIFVPLGLVLGWMARAGRMVQDRKPWSEIRRDLLVNVLIGGANAVMAGTIIWWLRLPYLPGVGVAFGCAFGGVPTLYMLWQWGWRHISADAIAGEHRQQEQRDASEAYLRRELANLREHQDEHKEEWK